MIIDFYLTVNPNKIQISVPKASSTITEMPNLAAYNLSNNLPYAFGITEEEIKKNLDSGDHQPRIGFRPLFSIDTINSSLERAFLEYETSKAHNTIFPSFPKWLRYYFIDHFDYYFWIPGYDQLPMINKIQFEASLRIYGRVHKISINGNQETISYRKLLTERIIRFIVEGLPAVLIMISLVAFLKNIFLGIVLIIFALLLMIISQVTWLCILHRFFPQDYLTYRLHNLSFSFIAKRLTGLIWRGTENFNK